MYDAIIIGGGACGLMCAAQAGLLGKKTLLIEGNERVGEKILISGGGRCNYTNLYTDVENFLSENPRFLKSVFSQWTVEDTVDFFERAGIVGKEKTLGQLFPTTNKAKDIVAVFTDIIEETGQTLLLGAKATGLVQVDGGFEVMISDNGREKKVRAAKVVVTTGGLPVAKMGASDFALRVARQFDMRLVDTAPALVPLTITGKNADWYASLSGNTVFSRVYNSKISFEENILFTHWGLSGPAILQISSYWRPGDEFTIDLLPVNDLAQIIKEEREKGGKYTVGQVLGAFFTKRMVEALKALLPVDIKIASLSKADAQTIVQVVHGFKVKPAGDKGYNKAEVMRGGIDTNELYPQTLESKTIRGLYFGGECVDVTGWLGGYNFQWAWAAGYVIAQNI